MEIKMSRMIVLILLLFCLGCKSIPMRSETTVEIRGSEQGPIEYKVGLSIRNL